MWKISRVKGYCLITLIAPGPLHCVSAAKSHVFHVLHCAPISEFGDFDPHTLPPVPYDPVQGSQLKVELFAAVMMRKWRRVTCVSCTITVEGGVRNAHIPVLLACCRGHPVGEAAGGRWAAGWALVQAPGDQGVVALVMPSLSGYHFRPFV